MGLWAAGGAFVLLSILVVAELIAMTPKSGGPYALVANAFGPYPGFLLGWTDSGDKRVIGGLAYLTGALKQAAQLQEGPVIETNGKGAHVILDYGPYIL